MAYISKSGITFTHYGIFEQAARALNRVIIVRNTNEKSTPWIEKGYPPKPRTIKIHTSKETGKVTCLNADEIKKARAAGFYVIDQDGMARNAAGAALPERFRLGDEQEQDEAGQVIHPEQHLALVGDYDLLAVIDPLAPGRNIVLAAENGEAVEDRLGPEVERLMDFMNPRFDQPRIMHGAHDQWDDIPEGGSTVFFTGGPSQLIGTRDEMANLYAFIQRESIRGSYASGAGNPTPGGNVIPFPGGFSS
jgi:hypothetical protein